MADEMIESFSLGVIEKIPLLLGTHDDEAMERTVGVVNGLEKEDDGLYFTTEITDDDTLEKLNTTTEDGVRLYSGVSASFGPLNNEDGKERYAVIHVALTHKPVITGLKDFVALSMAISNEDAMYNFEISLSDLERKVRRAFYDQVRDNEDYDYYYDIWIADVFDNYVICEKGDGTYSKYNFAYSSDGGIVFNQTSVMVEKRYVEVVTPVEEFSMVTTEEVLEFLKEQGIEVEAIENLKKNNKVTGELMNQFEVEDADTLMDKIKEVDSQKEKSAKEFANKEAEMTARILSLETAQKKSDAEKAVDSEIRNGKVLPVQREQYISLYMGDDGEMFKSLMKDAPTLVETKELGVGSGITDADLSTEVMTEEQVDNQKEYYLSMVTGDKKGETE